MISAPLRPTQTTDAAHITTHGHLALLEWEETLPAAAPAPFGPHPRTFLDRCYEGGTAVLLAVSAGALIASLARF